MHGHWGVIKADVGVRDGRIVALGKAGNPDIMDGDTPGLVIGPSTEVIAGNGLGPATSRSRVNCYINYGNSLKEPVDDIWARIPSAVTIIENKRWLSVLSN